VRLRALIGAVVGGTALAVVAGCGLTESEPDLVAGKRLFVERCGSCHILNRAETTGVQGPNLDEAFRKALSEGFGRGGVEGVVLEQIKFPADVPRNNPAYMPADLVKGDDARNVAAYVAEVSAKGGEDTGLLAEAVKKPGGGEPAVARNGVLNIPATAQLAYETNAATAEPGQLTIRSPNPSGTPHNIAIDFEDRDDELGPVVQNNGVSEIEVDLRPGEYTFFCSVPGHREGGMAGKLTVRR
jgi:plastocyanin